MTSGNCIDLGPSNAIDVNGEPIWSYNGSYVFGSTIEEMNINGGNIYRGADKAVVYTQGAHQPSRIQNCWIRGVVSYGVHWDQGLGGPANFDISGTDVEAGTTNPMTGTKTGIMVSGGGAVVKLDKVNVQGAGGGSNFVTGIHCFDDNVVGENLHFEYCDTGYLASQNVANSKRANTLINVTGHSSVPRLINRTNPTGNSLVCINVSNQSTATTGLVVIRDNGTDVVSDTVVSFYNNGD